MYIKGVKLFARIKFDFLGSCNVNKPIRFFFVKLKKATCIISYDVFKYYMKKRLYNNFLVFFKTLKAKNALKKLYR